MTELYHEHIYIYIYYNKFDLIVINIWFVGMKFMVKCFQEDMGLKKDIFSTFLNKVEGFPLWIKQIICLKLSEDIKAQVCEKFLSENSDNIFSLYCKRFH